MQEGKNSSTQLNSGDNDGERNLYIGEMGPYLFFLHVSV